MKVYIRPEPMRLVKLEIKKQWEKTEYISLQDCEVMDVENHIKVLLQWKVDPFATWYRTRINIRKIVDWNKYEWWKTISLHWICPKDIYDLIISSFNS